MKQGHLHISLILLLCATLHLPAQPQPGTLLWSYAAPSAIYTSPAVSPDGTIFVGTQFGLYAITNAGSNRWSFAADVRGSPAIGTDGTIYFGDYAGTFYALKPDGSQKWSFATNLNIWSSPALGFDDTVYFAASGFLVALSGGGTKKWDYQFSSSSTPGQDMAPTIGSDGTIYIGGGALHALAPGGTRRWFSALESGAGSSLAIGPDGNIYVTGGRLYAFTPNGTNSWSASGDFTGASPAVGKDGTIYVESLSGPNSGINAFTSSGNLLWYAGASPGHYGFPTTSPAIDKSGTVYLCASNSLFAISTQGVVLWVFTAAGGPSNQPLYSSPAIGPNGTIYACLGKTLYALAGTNKLAESSWPMYRQNLRHTGEIEKPSLQQPKKRAAAGFQFQLMSQLDSTNLIQTSPDLITWTLLTNILITNVPMDFIDWDATNFPSRFYRAVQQ